MTVTGTLAAIEAAKATVTGLEAIADTASQVGQVDAIVDHLEGSFKGVSIAAVAEVTRATVYAHASSIDISGDRLAAALDTVVSVSVTSDLISTLETAISAQQTPNTQTFSFTHGPGGTGTTGDIATAYTRAAEIIVDQVNSNNDFRSGLTAVANGILDGEVVFQGTSSMPRLDIGVANSIAVAQIAVDVVTDVAAAAGLSAANARVLAIETVADASVFSITDLGSTYIVGVAEGIALTEANIQVTAIPTDLLVEICN